MTAKSRGTVTTQTRRWVSPLASRPYFQYVRRLIERTTLVWIAPAGARITPSRV